MRVLFLTQVVPFPPDSGPKIKTYQVLRRLAQRHEIHLVSLVRSAAEAAQTEALTRLCSSVRTVPIVRSRARDVASLTQSLVTGRPFLIERDDSRGLRSMLGAMIQEQAFDAVHADQLAMAQFACDLPLPLRVLDEHNAVWTIVRRMAGHARMGVRRAVTALEWRKLRVYEGQMCRSFDRVTVVSQEDRAALEAAAGTAFAAHVIPIAVDTSELRFVPRDPEARRILSVATMFYPPNAEGVHWFATEVFPLIRGAVPGTQFDIVGSRPSRDIQRLATPSSGVVVRGYISDLDPLLGESGVLIVPVHAGSGMRVKILEAFARGIPVVSTTVGAEGIDARAGEQLLIADEPRDFAAAVVRLLDNPEEGARLARAARALVEARYDWRVALGGLDEVYPLPGVAGLAPA